VIKRVERRRNPVTPAVSEKHILISARTQSEAESWTEEKVSIAVGDDSAHILLAISSRGVIQEAIEAVAVD
jgi:hypothetical protein